MKQLLVLAVLINLTTSASAQNSVRQLNPPTALPANNPWDLNKYIWSHTHPLPSKGSKPIMDFDAIEKDISLGLDLAISPDGRYFAWSIQNTLYRRLDTLVVQATTGSWRQTFTGAKPGVFSGDSKLYIFQSKEGLCFLQTGSGQARVVNEVASYQQPDNGKGEWLAYQLQNKEATLVVQNLFTEKEKHFDGVSGYGFDRTGQWLACQLNNQTKDLVLYNLSAEKEQHFQSVADYLFHEAGKALVVKTIDEAGAGLQYISLPEGTMHPIRHTIDSITSISSYSMDGSGRQVVFIEQEVSPHTGISGQSNAIWYWRTDMNKAVLKVNNHTDGIEDGLLIQGTATFTDNDRYILFSLQPQEADLPKPDPAAVKLDVWSYKDTILQSTQPYLLKMPAKMYQAIIHTAASRVIRLEKEFETRKKLLGDFAVIGKSVNEKNGDRFWEKDYYKDSLWLLSLKDGTRRFLGKPARGGAQFAWLSPGGKYLVYFDADQQCNYFSIDLHTGKRTKISAGVLAWQLGQIDPYLRPREKPQYCVGIAGWLEGDSGLLVYDHYDIWQLDLTGKKPALNITNGYGRRNHIQFRLAELDQFQSALAVLPEKASLLLRAFNITNKHNGFYHKVLEKTGNPDLLYMGPCLLATDDLGMKPLKAYGTNVWIVKRQTAIEAPNYFLTTDFKSYKPLTDLQPQKAYNWFTAELHSFKQLDGTMSQGILYKPENFDPTKKYPTIIVFYGTFSNQAYVYPNPGYMDCPSAPKDYPGWLTSHGYLVFLPDIYFTKGKWGPSALNTVDGAAEYLSKQPFADSKRMGACGHSNSGRTAYYILTHSRSFAAMSVGASQSNIISAALSLRKSSRMETSYLEWIENETYGTALGNLWENRDSWLDHTAVLHAEKATSPVLLFHNAKDGHPLAQVIEIFIALRRLEKKAWWLQYNDEGHRVNGEATKDFTIRYTQYFDHYLKGAPPPRWMTQGLPARFKQVEHRYELDLAGSCGNQCPVCQAHKTRKPGE